MLRCSFVIGRIGSGACYLQQADIFLEIFSQSALAVSENQAREKYMVLPSLMNNSVEKH